MTMVATSGDQQSVQCEDVLKRIQEGERELEALKSQLENIVMRLEELEAMMEQLPPTEQINQPAIESETGKAQAKKIDIECLIREQEAQLLNLKNDMKA